MSDPNLDYFLFCDKLLTNRTDNRETFVGLFQSVSARQFPFVIEAFHIKIAIRNFRFPEGNPSVIVNVKHPRTSAVIGSTGARLDQMGGHSASAKNPTRFKLGFTMKNLTFAEPGKYEVQLVVENETVVSRVLQVQMVGERKSPK